MNFSAAWGQPRFGPGDTGYDSGLGAAELVDSAYLTVTAAAYFAAQVGAGVLEPTVENAMRIYGSYPNGGPAKIFTYQIPSAYPLLGKDPWPAREAAAIATYRSSGYYAARVRFSPFSANKNLSYNVDPSDSSDVAVAQAMAYPGMAQLANVGMGMLRWTITDWNNGYKYGDEGTYSPFTTWNRPGLAEHLQTLGGALTELAINVSLVGGGIVAGAFAATEGAAVSTLTVAPAASVAVPAAAVAGSSGSLLTTAALTVGKTLAGVAVSKAVASVVASKPETTANQQALMAAQLQQAQASQAPSENTGLLLAGGLLLLKILL